MRVVIIEDEWGPQEILKRLISEYDPLIQIDTVIDSVRNSIVYFKNKPEIDLVFMDIHLSDGISFDIFDEVNIDQPIIFITAYDQYAIKAFKHNSVDYLLKPLIKTELFEALNKFKAFPPLPNITKDLVNQVICQINEAKPSFRKSFLIQSKDNLIPILIDDILAFFVDLGVVKCYTRNHKMYVLSLTLDQIENEVDSAQFFRVNRQYILQMESIKQMNIYFNGKLKIKTICHFDEDIVVSKQKAIALKKWFSS